MSVQANHPPRRKAYLLHVWEERLAQGAQTSRVRYRIEDPHSGKTHSFADANALVRFLQVELGAQNADGEESDRATDGIVRRLQRKFMPLSDVQLGSAAAGTAEPELPDFDEQQSDDSPNL